MGRKVTVAVATLNQWAMDFEGNMNRILQSIIEARELGALYRTGPELEVTGYSCEDHFQEPDTLLHAWEVLAYLLQSPCCQNMLIDVGMPVQHRNVTYNCRVLFLNRRILLVRPKLTNCDDGCYRETRWFTAWPRRQHLDQLPLPAEIVAVCGQLSAPIGDALLSLRDTCLGFEICEELWHVRSTHIEQSLAGAEIIANSSGSYMQLRKAFITTDLVRSASFKALAAYVFANARGCDGQRVYFNGCSAVALNGDMIARSSQFALQEVEVTAATFDLDDIRAARMAQRSWSLSAAAAVVYPRIEVDFQLSAGDLYTACSRPLKWTYHTAEEEIALGPACWLWDYLRRSGQGGYFLPLSGGVDSASSALIVHSMCRLVVEAVQAGDAQVLDDVRRILGDATYTPSTAQALCERLLVTCYMGGQNSSAGTRRLAAQLAAQLGSHHLEVNIDGAVSAVLAIFTTLTGAVPKFRAHGGCARQNVALQNIQARVRMVVAYLLAQLMLWVRGRPGGLLVLGSANVDESLRGYMTKYDCSAADVNPIGGISKADLHRFLVYAAGAFDVPAVGPIVEQPPTAELEPLRDGQVAQTDEQDMGMSYAELSEFGRLRKQAHCGPFSMFSRLVGVWSDRCTAAEVAEKVKHFFRCYAINRHKMTVLTPSYHAESYSPDDNRFDHRPFLYRANWSWQFRAIDQQLKQLTADVNSAATLPKRPTPPIPVGGLPPSAVDARPAALVTQPQPHQARGTPPFVEHLASCSNGTSVRTPAQTMTPSACVTPASLDGAGSSGSLKRHGHQKVSNTNVMGKIRDRTGVPV